MVTNAYLKWLSETDGYWWTDTAVISTMDEAIENAYKYTAKGKICLFSPAASSYNRYKNFEEKGNHFKILAKEFAHGRCGSVKETCD